MNTENHPRIISYDILRILSALGVILMHVTSGALYSNPIHSGAWTAAALVNGAAHFGVPVFVMISGALFLDPSKEVDIKRLWKHSILRLAIVLLVWNCFYGITDFFGYKASLKYLVWEIVDGRHHLWFLPMIIGLYIVTPLLLRWIKTAPVREVRYIMIMFLTFCVAWETMVALIPAGIVDFAGKYRNIPLVCGYAGYYILGYYIAHVGISEHNKGYTVLFGLLGLMMGEAGFVIISRSLNEVRASLVDSFSAFTCLYAVGLFVLITELKKKGSGTGKLDGVISNIGKDTLGIYLCHIALLERAGVVGEFCSSLPMGLGYVLLALILFVVGMIISAVLRRIPVVGRYIC